MDDISLKILKILQQKARIPNVEVARRVGLAPSAVLERIRKLESQGIIDGYEVRLNPEHFKKSLIAFVNVFTKKHENPKTGEALSSIPEVQEVHYITGQDCYFLKLRVSGTEELHRILQEQILSIENVKETHTTIALSTYKETSRIPLNIPAEKTKENSLQ